jgi:MFS family permease
VVADMNKNDRSIIGLVMVSHALVHTYELTIPIFMVIWLSEFSVTAALLGGIVSVGYALFGIGALPGGTLSDKYGSQNLIALCLGGMGLSFVTLGFANNIFLIAISICMWGAAASIYHPSGLSLISTGVEDRGAGFAYHGMAGNVGIAFGPLVAVLLLLFLDWQTVAIILALPAFISVGYILSRDINEMAASESVPDGGTPSKEDKIDSIRDFTSSTKTLFAGGFVLVFLVIMFNGLYYRGILTFLPDMLAGYINQTPTSSADSELIEENLQASDLVYVGLLMIGVAGQYIGGKATDQIPTERGLLMGYIVLAIIGFLFIPAFQASSTILIFVCLALGFFLFMLQPIYQATVAEYTPAESRGLSYGYTYLAQFGIGALGAAIVGAVLTYSPLAFTFLLLSGFAVVAAILSLLLLLRI